MKYILVFFRFILLLIYCSSFSAACAQTKFGALVQAPHDLRGHIQQQNFKLQVAGKLGTSCIRDGMTLFNPGKKTLLGNGYEVLLNISVAPTKVGNKTLFPADADKLKNQLMSIADSWREKPVVVAVENEMANRFFYADRPGAYIKELQAAVEILHPRGVKVCDGGFNMPPLLYLYAHTLSPDSCKKVLRRNGVGDWAKDAARFADTLLTAIHTMDLDYVNIHWYHKEGSSLNDLAGCIEYLQQRTGKTVISNEIGQYDDDVSTTQQIVDITRKYKLPYVVFYSGNSNEKPKPLHNSDGTLTAIGNAYAAAIKNN